MWVQAAAVGMVATGSTFVVWAVAVVLLGTGTAMLYPTLLATISDVAHPAWRARAVGIYRLWRDGGFALGALLTGVIADAYSLATAIWTVAAPHRFIRPDRGRLDARTDARRPSRAAGAEDLRLS
jgi:MFS family permease